MDKVNSKIKVWILIMFFGFPAFYPFLNSIIHSSSLAHISLVMATYLPLAYLFIVRKEKVKTTYFYFVFIFFLIIVFYSVLNINQDYLFESYALPCSITFFSGIIGYFIMAIQDDSVLVHKGLKILTIVLIINYYIYTLTIETKESYSFGYDMFLGFRMLFPCLLAINFAFIDGIKKMEKIFWLFMVAWSLFVIISYGSRGPLLGIFMYIIMRFVTLFLASPKYSSTKKILITFAIILSMVMVYVYFKQLLLLLSDQLDNLGISSRTVRRFLNDQASDDNGRLPLFNAALSMLNLFGYGPYSDQYYFGEGNYVHNFVIEIFFDFGIIGGLIVLIICLYNFFRITSRKKKSNWYDIFVVLFSYCFGRLIFSGTFWTETNFWVLLGVGSLCLQDYCGEEYE